MAGELRRPRGYLAVDGGRVECESIEVHLGREAKSDTFHAVLAMSAVDVAYWCDTAEIAVQVIISEDGEGGETLLTGNVAQVHPNWLQRTIEISGHDKSKPMTEKKSLSEAFKNKTAKDIIEEVAKRHGLKVQIDADTLKAGRLYDIDTVHHARELTDWDLVNYLADHEGLVAAVDGDTLFVGTDDENNLPTLDVSYEEPTAESYARGDFIALGGSRNLNLTGKTTVSVKSWDHKTKKAIEGKKTLGASGGKSGDGITYEHQAPGLKQDRASRIAEKRLKRATKQERQITLDLPGQTRIRARMNTNLSGTGTTFDQRYENESAEHRLNQEEGYRCLVTAKAASKDRETSDE